MSHSSGLNGNVGVLTTFGGLIAAAGFSLSQPDRRQNRKNVFIRSSFFNDDIGESFQDSLNFLNSSTETRTVSNFSSPANRSWYFEIEVSLKFLALQSSRNARVASFVVTIRCGSLPHSQSRIFLCAVSQFLVSKDSRTRVPLNRPTTHKGHVHDLHAVPLFLRPHPAECLL